MQKNKVRQKRTLYLRLGPYFLGNLKKQIQNQKPVMCLQIFQGNVHYIKTRHYESYISVILFDAYFIKPFKMNFSEAAEALVNIITADKCDVCRLVSI